MLVAIVGMPGAGKSVASDFFKSKGVPVLRFGDETDRGLVEYNLPRIEKNERFIREKLRKELGMAAMAIKIHPRIEEVVKTHEKIVLDGLYSWEEYMYLKRVYSGLTLLCIYASPKIRHERLSKRLVRPLTEAESISRDVAEIENLHKGGPIAVADYLIINDCHEDQFIQELEKYYKKYL